jgi:hypothetical protein
MSAFDNDKLQKILLIRGNYENIESWKFFSIEYN